MESKIHTDLHLNIQHTRPNRQIHRVSPAKEEEVRSKSDSVSISSHQESGKKKQKKTKEGKHPGPTVTEKHEKLQSPAFHVGVVGANDRGAKIQSTTAQALFMESPESRAVRSEKLEPPAKKVVLISCVSMKSPKKAKAKDLYISPLFKLNMQYAKKLNPDNIYILSAKYGLVELNEEIAPYNLTLNDMSANDVKKWTGRVFEQLQKKTDVNNTHFIFLAGEKYRKYLIPQLSSYEVPMEGLGIGRQLHFLVEKTS